MNARHALRTGMRTGFVAVLAALVVAAPARGQPAPTLPAQLTLDDAIAYALRNSPEHLQRLNDEDVAAAQMRASYGAFLPTLNLGTGFSGNWSRTVRTTDFFGEPLPAVQPIESSTSGANQGLSWSLTLFDGARNFANIASAKANQRFVEADVVNAANTLRANVARRYYAAVRAEQRIALERQLESFSTDRLDMTERQFRIAAARQTDVLGARSEVAQKRLAVLNAEADARARRLDLLEAMGVAGEPAFALVTELPTAADPAGLDVEALVVRARSNSPRILAAAARTRQADKQASVSRGQRWPSISLSGNYGRGTSGESGFFGAWGKLDLDNQSAGLNLNVSLPVFSRFQTSSQIAQADAAADDARYQERLTRIQVEKEVRAALIELQRTYQALILAEEEASLSSERLELAEQEYQAGVTAFTALQQIIQQNEQAQRAAVDARFNYVTAQINLEERLGGPLDGGD